MTYLLNGNLLTKTINPQAPTNVINITRICITIDVETMYKWIDSK